MSRTCSPENDITRDIALEITAATAIPANNNVATWTVGPIRANRYTRNAVRRAPAKAASGTPKAPSAPEPANTMTAIAPSAAPEETPMMAGSASGLRNRPWNTAPDAAKAAPTTAARTTRGRRSWSRITSVDAGTPVGRPENPSFHAMTRALVHGEIQTDPTATPRRNDPRGRAASTARIRPNRRGAIMRTLPYAAPARGAGARRPPAGPACSPGPHRRGSPVPRRSPPPRPSPAGKRRPWGGPPTGRRRGTPPGCGGRDPQPTTGDSRSWPEPRPNDNQPG